jgi:hypothetical protein
MLWNYLPDEFLFPYGEQKSMYKNISHVIDSFISCSEEISQNCIVYYVFIRVLTQFTNLRLMRRKIIEFKKETSSTSFW